MNLFDDLPEPKGKSDGVSIISKTEIGSADMEHQPNLLPTLFSVVARKGERPEMQDAHVCIDDFSTYFRTPLPNEIHRLSYFAVFDGHGGCRASTFAAKRLHPLLASRLPKGLQQIEKDIRRIFYDIFKKTDEDFLREACQQRPRWRDGSTASVVLLVNNILYVANLGDSKIVLARRFPVSIPEETDQPEGAFDSGYTNSTRIVAVCLTRDHNPMDYEERQRIQSTGSTVQNGRVNNILEVSRSFGDYQFKKQGVTCIPDTKKYQLTDQDKFLLIACDGLWKSFPPEEAVALTDRLLMKEFASLTSERNQGISGSDAARLVQRCIESVCTHLVNEAVLRMSGDNVTCILVVLPDAYALFDQLSSAGVVLDKSVIPGMKTTGAEIGVMEVPSKLSRLV